MTQPHGAGLALALRDLSQEKKVLRLIHIFLTPPSFEKIPPVCQPNSPQARITASSSKNAVSFS
jgi:hypothetical protein